MVRCSTDEQNEYFTKQSTTYPLYPTSPPPSSSPSIPQIRKEAMIENFGESLGNDPKIIPSWGILTNLSSHSISMMRELIGSPISVGYASRSGGIGSRSEGQGGKEGEGMGWWNVIFDYEGFKAHYEVCSCSPFAPAIPFHSTYSFSCATLIPIHLDIFSC